MEIERKFLIDRLPENMEAYPSKYIEQAYLCTDPVVRVRRQDQEYILTYKGKGMMIREEYNLPLTEEAYAHLKAKADGNVISKRRYLIPLGGSLTAELDVFFRPFCRTYACGGGVCLRRGGKPLLSPGLVWPGGHLLIDIRTTAL